jgi:hypothetical protein
MRIPCGIKQPLQKFPLFYCSRELIQNVAHRDNQGRCSRGQDPQVELFIPVGGLRISHTLLGPAQLLVISGENTEALRADPWTHKDIIIRPDEQAPLQSSAGVCILVHIGKTCPSGRPQNDRKRTTFGINAGFPRS